MIIVTGGAGFIGSNIVRALNQRDITDIIVVDDLSDGRKFNNIVDCDIQDYLDKDVFYRELNSVSMLRDARYVFHEGACSSTTEWDGKMMLNNNYAFSKRLLHFCNDNQIPFSYASSASTYGQTTSFKEVSANEYPLNVYGYSKLLFDQYVRRHRPFFNSQIVGFRYFNVYGPGEGHKGPQASVAYHFNEQIKKTGVCNLFSGTNGYADGEQQRDFVYVVDLVKTKLWFMDNLEQSGIFNLGTGKCQSFNELANAVIAWHNKGKINYIPFPEHLSGAYQNYTEANIQKLREAGYKGNFSPVEKGVKEYLDCINNNVRPTY